MDKTLTEQRMVNRRLSVEPSYPDNPQDDGISKGVYSTTKPTSYVAAVFEFRTQELSPFRGWSRMAFRKGLNEIKLFGLQIDNKVTSIKHAKQVKEALNTELNILLAASLKPLTWHLD